MGQICEWCGKWFEKPANSLAQYCSVQCRTAKRKEIQAAKPPKAESCKWCGKIFFTRNKREQWCSDECRRKSYGVKDGLKILYAPNLINHKKKSTVEEENGND